MKISIPQSVTRTLSRQVLVARKQSPHILFAAGVVGVIGATVLACKATLKVGPVLDDFKLDIEGVKAMENDANETRKGLAYVYIRDTTKIVRLYAPAIVVGTASIAALTGSHITLTKRNSALTATVVTLTETFNQYRDRVREEVGEEKERDIYHGVLLEKTKDENGKEVMRRVLSDGVRSPYARIFDETNINWRNNSEYNNVFLTYQQNYFNHMLQARGHVFLNEVYTALGFEHTREGAVVGWVAGSDGDNYIDFGIFSDTRFVNGWEPSVIVDFNVDGIIFDKI